MSTREGPQEGQESGIFQAETSRIKNLYVPQLKWRGLEGAIGVDQTNGLTVEQVGRAVCTCSPDSFLGF